MHNWTGNYLVNNPGDLRFYGTGVPGIWFNSSTNGGQWSGYTSTNITGGDPTVVKVSPDNYLMIYTGPQYPVGLNESSPGENEINILPNPASGTLFIHFKDKPDKSKDFLICNLQGKKVMSGRLSEKLNEINLGDLAPGGYLLTISEGWTNAFFIIRE
jgi:hypothetical protein